MDLGLSGLASGFDWKSLVNQLVDVERAPEQRLLRDQSLIQQRRNAYSSIQTQLQVLKNRLEGLQDPGLFEARTASSGDSAIATASAQAGTAAGSYLVNIQQRAAAAAQRGAANAGSPISASADVSGVVMSSANFATGITAGTFTVNGKQVTLALSDTLEGVFNKISTATSGTVTASYDSATDKISLSSSGAITLGSGTDSSNFLQAAKLVNNGTGSVSSYAELGVVQLSKALSSANLAAAISDGGSGAGVFKINGASISFDASSDTVSTVLKRINDSSAGVTASYDPVADRFVLANKTTGDIGIALEDVTGNFLAATGLSSGTLTRGKNLLYTINSGAQLQSQSNTIDSASSGIDGLTISALKEGETTVSVGSDTSKIKTAINDFITEYNRVQSLIDSQTASTTDAQGKVTAGILANESDASEIASKLRSTAFGEVSGRSGTLTSLAKIGIDSNGDDNTLRVSDDELLDSVLANNLSGVRELFADAETGVAAQLSGYLEKTIGEDGTLVSRQDLLLKQSSDIDGQVADMERLVLSNKERLTQSFIAMEAAQARANQQLQYLQQRFK